MINRLLREEIEKTLNVIFPSVEAEGVTVSSLRQFGDYTTNAAMVVSARVGKTAKETAKSIVAQLDKSEETKKRILKMEIAGPGFINFFSKTK